MGQMIVRALFCIILGYLVGVVLVYAGQRQLQYHPDRNYPGTPADNGMQKTQELRVRTEDGLSLLAWFSPPREKEGRVVVLYHGNAGDISSRAYKMRQFMAAGYGVYLCEYRGYGGNPGSPTEEGIYKDARSALHWLEAKGYKRSQWILYGESLGSGPAVQMAVEFQLKYMVLEGAFSSAADVAEEKYFWLPARFLLKDKFNNIGKIKSVHASLLMLHGDKDQVVSYHLAQKLYAAANMPKKFVTIEGGGHNDLYEYHAGRTIIEWLKKGK